MNNNILVTSLLLMFFAIIFSFKSSFFFLKLSKKYKNIATLKKNPFPPDKINPIDLWTLSYPEHNLTIEKLSSILIYYANKGLITISYFNTNYYLRQTKPLSINDFENEYEYNFINKLFELSRKSDGSLYLKTISKKDLNFFTDLIYKSKECNFKKNNYLLSPYKNFNFYVYILTFPLAFISMFLFLLYYLNSFYYSITFTFLITIVCVLLIPINYLLRNIHWTVSLVLCSAFIFILINLIISFNWISSSNINIPTLIFISFGFSLLSSQYPPKRYIHTTEGLSLIEKTLEFKNFIENSSIDVLKKYFTDNTSYYYDILPYAICLNVSYKLDAIIDTLALPNPPWFIGEIPFKYHHFKRVYLLKILKLYHNTAK